MATIDLGKIKLVNKNTWDTNTTYTADDIFQYTDNGILSTYICVVSSSQGHTPSSSGTTHASWNFLAKGIADPIPSQSGNADKVLKTNGSVLSWGTGTNAQRIAGAWVNFNADASTPSARDSYNVSSITDHGDGQHTVNFTTACANTQYCVVAGCATFISGTNSHINSLGSVSNGMGDANTQTGSCKIWTQYLGSAGQQDPDYLAVAFFGDWS